MGISSIVALKSCYIFIFPAFYQLFYLIFPLSESRFVGYTQMLSGGNKREDPDWVCLPEVTEELIQTQQNQAEKSTFLNLLSVQGLSLTIIFNTTPERT